MYEVVCTAAPVVTVVVAAASVVGGATVVAFTASVVRGVCIWVQSPVTLDKLHRNISINMSRPTLIESTLASVNRVSTNG